MFDLLSCLPYNVFNAFDHNDDVSYLWLIVHQNIISNKKLITVEMTLGHLYWDQELFDEKTGVKASRETGPLIFRVFSWEHWHRYEQQRIFLCEKSLEMLLANPNNVFFCPWKKEEEKISCYCFFKKSSVIMLPIK